jgi:hypothetical protein
MSGTGAGGIGGTEGISGRGEGPTRRRLDRHHRILHRRVARDTALLLWHRKVQRIPNESLMSFLNKINKILD